MVSLTPCKIIQRIKYNFLVHISFFLQYLHSFFSLFYNMLSTRVFYHPVNGMFRNYMNIYTTCAFDFSTRLFNLDKILIAFICMRFYMYVYILMIPEFVYLDLCMT